MRFCTLLLFIFFSVNCSAQFPAEIRFTNYNRSNGLSEEFVNNITQDSRGYLWLGSREGLIRFDGLYFKTWYANTNDSTKFYSNNISVIEEYKPGWLLFISGANLWQINIFNHQLKKISRFSSADIIVHPHRLNSTRWYISKKDSFYITNNDFTVLHSFAINKFYPAGSLVDCYPLQNSWLMLYIHGTDKKYLVNYETKQVLPFNLKNERLDSRAAFYTPVLYDNGMQRLYLSTYFNGNFYCDLQLPQNTNYTPLPFLQQPNGAIRKMMLLPGNKMIQAGDFGLYFVSDTGRNVFKADAFTGNMQTSDAVLSICKTNEQLYWIATMNGISRFSLDEPVFKYSSPEAKDLSIDDIKSMIKTDANTIYLLTERNSLLKFNKQEKKFTQVEKKIAYAWTAVKLTEDILIGGAGQKLAVYNIASGKTNYPAFLQPYYTANTDLVTLIYKARNGDTWYSCNGGAGIMRSPAGSSQLIQYSRQSSPPTFSHSYVHCAAEDSNGNIWWGNNKSAQLLKWNTTTRQFEEKFIGALLPQYNGTNGINHLYVDASDNLWIALDGAGLIKYNVNTRLGDYYDINKGLPADGVTSITGDSQKRIWLGTRKGLGCYLPEKNKIVTFTTYDGLPNDNFESRGVLYDKETNLLYIGSKNTLIWFNPDTLLNKTILQQPKVFIDAMFVNSKPWYFENEKNITLQADENNIEFSFSAVDYARNNQLQFQYKLSGTGNNWTETGESRSVSFNNLPYGSYTLSIRCKYKETDTWKETSYPFTFTILTPWYKKTWFMLLLIAATAIIAAQFLRLYYLRQMEKQKILIEKELAIEQERTRMARELHDGLGSMLSGIKHSFSAMENQMDMNETQQQRFQFNIEKINETITELRSISHSMATDNMLKFGFVNSLQDYCRNISQPAGLNISFSAIETTNINLSEEVSLHLFRIIQELIQNIIKHAKANNAIVQLSGANNKLSVTVEDDGTGFDLNNISQKEGIGLKNIAARLKIIKGVIDYKSEKGKGTSVLIEIPLT
ncbi:hypothetical protein ESA94_03565 [Lacibacter luteus]|uniref:Histidine kinase domain-containing protein n=1 Tax=Lacibacter luteus TaxID=2508719 RepID=A0A4Q1CM57_9BACT|nr:sensor histidine kinase [Lacibacter luteus]RXK62103.1 hypothetical protein ESA94_03565 [Lacibacter luteus]